MNLTTWCLWCAVFAADLTTPVPDSCAELTCYFGASCEEHRGGHAECVCRSTCADEDPSSSHVVCGNDGQTYGSECQLKLFACRYQKDIVVQALGPCKGYSWCDLFWYFYYPWTFVVSMFDIFVQYRVLFVYNWTLSVLYLYIKCHSPYSNRVNLLFELSQVVSSIIRIH